MTIDQRMKAGNFSGNLWCTLHEQWPVVRCQQARAARVATAARMTSSYSSQPTALPATRARARGLETCKRLLLAEGLVWWLPGEAATVKSVSEMGEQWLPFVVMAAGERKRWI